MQIVDNATNYDLTLVKESDMPIDVITLSCPVYIHFVSDSSDVGVGFKLRWEENIPDTTTLAGQSALSSMSFFWDVG